MQAVVEVSVQFISRAGCHHCVEAMDALGKAASACQVQLRIDLVDLDQEAEAAARYGAVIPVVIVEQQWLSIGPTSPAALTALLRCAVVG